MKILPLLVSSAQQLQQKSLTIAIKTAYTTTPFDNIAWSTFTVAISSQPWQRHIKGEIYTW